MSAPLTAEVSSSLAARRAVVLVNIGTPDAPTVPAVRKYLAEFLGDPRVIDLPAPARWMLLRLIILPFRPKRSAHAYQQIWTKDGSPLMLNAQAQAVALQAQLPDYEVVLAMRYGNPSLPSVLEGLRARGVTELIVVPMYPQHASATTGTTLERIAELSEGFSVKSVPAFHSREGFIAACAEQVRQTVETSGAEHVLFSYHGLPIRQLKPVCHQPCASEPCPPLGAGNAQCYRAQCYATSADITRVAGLTKTSTSFQSRLKGATWLSPFTDEVVVQLAQQGVKRLAVACPSFVADCLETLEEIGMRAAESFKAAGGESFTMVPAVNASPRFISMLADEVRRSTP
jgi:protoporphyrin/coproporphyrin ferrochelatase